MSHLLRLAENQKQRTTQQAQVVSNTAEHVPPFLPTTKTDEYQQVLEHEQAKLPVDIFLAELQRQGASKRQVELCVSQLRNLGILQGNVLDMLVMSNYSSAEQLGTNFPGTASLMQRTVNALQSKSVR